MRKKTSPVSIWRAPTGESYPLIDATSALYASVTADDVSCAVEGDPCRCAIAQAFKRAAGSPDTLIGRTIAYVVLRIDGEDKAMRFRVPAKTRRAIDSFDETGDMDPDTLVLTPPRPTDTLESKRIQDKRMRQRWAEKGHTPRPASIDLSHRNSKALANTQVVRGS
jgi:hypothetical protein